MFEFIRTHQRLMQFILLLFIFPSFAFLGIESYTRFQEGDNSVAKVAGQSITEQDWENAQREHMERLRQMLGSQFDPRLVEAPESKQAILDNLIAQRVLALEAKNNRLTVTDQTLQQTILTVPGLTTEDGKFDVERYKALLSMQGMTPANYEARLRNDLTLQQISAAIQTTAFAPKAIVQRVVDINEQQRYVEEVLFRPAMYISQVKITDDMLKSHYEKNGDQFYVPEKIKAEYVILSNEALAEKISVTDIDIRSYYEKNAKRFSVEEQRRASHILIKVEKKASNAVKEEARKKAEKILIEVRKKPVEFAKLAKQYSDDPGSAERGGDLDFFSRGMMVKVFEDVVFNMSRGQISDLVESEFGYHIIYVTDIKPASIKPLEEVKGQIALEIKRQQATKKFSELAENFANIVYEQSDSLKPVADKLNLKVEIVSDLSRSPNSAVSSNAPFNHPKFLNALFSEEAIKNKRTTEAIEIAPSTLIAGRVVEYIPKTKRSFDDVKDVVRQQVLNIEAEKLAKKAGEIKLAELKEKGSSMDFANVKAVSRLNQQDLNSEAFAAVMKADVAQLPIYIGIDLANQGYGIYRISKVVQPIVKDDSRKHSEQQRIANILAQQEMLAYLAVLKEKAKVEIHKPIKVNSDPM